MKTPLLLVATGVICMSFGFIAGKGGGDGAGIADKNDAGAKGSEGANSRQASTRQAGGQRPDSAADSVLSSLLKGRAPSELTAEEAFTLLQPQMDLDWTGDPLETARKNYQYQLLASKLTPGVMEDVLALACESDVPQFRVNQLFGSYAARDWDKAMAWAEQQPDPDSLRLAAISRLALDDPARAGELYQRQLVEGKNRMATSEASYTLAATYAKLGQEEFFKFADSMPSGAISNLLSNGGRGLPKEDVGTFLTEVHKRAAAGKIESWAMTNLLHNTSLSHAEEVRKWVMSEESGDKRQEMEISLANSLYRSGKASDVDDLLRSAMTGAAGKEKDLVKTQARFLVSQNPELVEKLVNLLPEGQELTLEDVKGWGSRGYGRTDTILNVAKFLRSPDEQAAYLENINAMGGQTHGVPPLNAKDFEMMQHRMESMDLSADAVTRGKAALQLARERVLGK